jgi:hypothetical protein
MSARRVLGEQGQGHGRRAPVNAEGVGLVVIVHVPQRPGIAIEAMLGLLVIAKDVFGGRIRHGGNVV